jgi:tetratricopeptide (TPR) repeat protein
MKKILTILTVLVLIAGLGYCQEEDFEENGEEEDVEEVAPAPVTPEKVVARDTTVWADLMKWRYWQETSLNYLRSEMNDEAAAAAESSLVRSRALGLDLPVTGAYWGIWARRALKEKDLGKAQRYSRLASLADKYSFKNAITQYQINTRVLGFIPALGQLFQTISGYRDDFRFGYRALWLSVFAFSLFLMSGCLYFLFILTIKYLPYYFHLLADVMPKNWPYSGRMFLASSIGAGILIGAAGFSLALAILVPVGLVIVSAKTRERVMFWLSIGLIGISVVGFNLLHQFFLKAEQGRIEALARANTSDWDIMLVQSLTEQQQQDPSDLKPIYALSLMEKNRGRPDRAKAYLAAMIEASSNNPTALNNMGNLYFFEGEFDSAGHFYRRAIETDEHLAEAHYNLGQVYFKSIDFNQARAELEKAANLAPARMESRSRESGGNLVMDARLDGVMLWPEFWKDWKFYSSFSFGEFSSLTTLNFWLPVWVWLGLLALFVIWSVLSKDNLSVTTCPLCGKYICPRCQIMGQDGNIYCRECQHQVFSIQSTELQQKAGEMLSRQKTKRVKLVNGFTNLFLPGSFYVMQGSAVKGWFLSMFLGLNFAGVIFITSPWILSRLDLSLPKAILPVFAALFLIVALISWLGYFRWLKEYGGANAA